MVVEVAIDNQNELIGASLSEPHTSVTALRDACVCMYVCLRPYTENFNLTNRNESISTLHTCSWSMQVDTMDPSLSNSTPIDLLNARDRLRLEREKRLLLDCSVSTKETRNEDQAEVRQDGLDRLRVRRAAEQPVTRQTRLATDRQRTHEHRAAEGYRQTRLERLRERNVKLNMLQWNAPASLL